MTDYTLARCPIAIPWSLVAVVAVSSVVFFAGLGRSQLWDDDETRFASVAREMLVTGDWIVPRYNGELADKPAGLFWMIAASFALFGESSAAARICPAFCALLVVVMVWMLGGRLFGRSTAFWGSLATATSLLLAVEARAATADTALLAIVTAILLTASSVWWKEGRFLPAPWPRAAAIRIGLLAGLGILVKGLVALVVPMVALLLFHWWTSCLQGNGPPRHFVSQAWASLRSVRPLLVFVVAAAVILPWHLAVGRVTGGEWLKLFYWKHHVGRAFSVMEGHGGVPLLQLPWLFAGMFPWSVFLPLAVWRMWRSAVLTGRAAQEAAKLLISWSMVWLLLFSFTATQLPNYVLPAYPALGLCVGHLLSVALERPESMRNGWFYAACGGVCLGAIVIVGGFLVLSATLGVPALANLAWLAHVPLGMAFALGACVAEERRVTGLVIFAAAWVVFLLGVFGFAAPTVSALNPVPALVRQADIAAGGRAGLGTWRFSVPGVVWSAARPARACSSAKQAADFLASSPGSALLITSDAGFTELAEAAGGRLRVLAEARPLFRQGIVLLVGAE